MTYIYIGIYKWVCLMRSEMWLIFIGISDAFYLKFRLQLCCIALYVDELAVLCSTLSHDWLCLSSLRLFEHVLQFSTSLELERAQLFSFTEVNSYITICRIYISIMWKWGLLHPRWVGLSISIFYLFYDIFIL